MVMAITNALQNIVLLMIMTKTLSVRIVNMWLAQALTLALGEDLSGKLSIDLIKVLNVILWYFHMGVVGNDTRATANDPK